jgi:hypothetical protein
MVLNKCQSVSRSTARTDKSLTPGGLRVRYPPSRRPEGVDVDPVGKGVSHGRLPAFFLLMTPPRSGLNPFTDEGLKPSSRRMKPLDRDPPISLNVDMTDIDYRHRRRVVPRRLAIT